MVANLGGAGVGRQWVRAAAGLIWPMTCPGCGVAEAWCADCRPGPSLTMLLGPGTAVSAAGKYEGGAAAAIRAWKLAQRRDLTDPLGAHLADAVSRLTTDLDGVRVALIPVPVRPGSRRRRGADLVAELAAAAARRREGAYLHQCLSWRRRVGEQVGATDERRRRNLSHAMEAVDRPRDAVIVIDDVCTTGATLAEAVRAIRATDAGRPVAAAVVAIARRSR